MKFLRLRDVVKLTGLSRVTLWRLEKKGEFPARIHLAENRVGWIEDELIQWMKSRPRRRGSQPVLGGNSQPASPPVAR
jgi:prophage regulatory protein